MHIRTTLRLAAMIILVFGLNGLPFRAASGLPASPHTQPRLPSGYAVDLRPVIFGKLHRVVLIQEAERKREYLLVVQENKRKQQVQLTSHVVPQSSSFSTSSGPIQVDTAFWTRMNQCEEGGVWYNDGYNPGGHGQHFVGGLGMSTVAWGMAVRAAADRGVKLPSWANSASVSQQMTGAQAFADRYGTGGWACKV